MKTLKYICIAITAAFLSCSDLEEDAVSVLSPNGFFNSPRDVQTVINGAIANFAEEAVWGRKMSLPIMLRSDMVGIGDPSTAERRRNVDNFVMNDDNGMVTVMWPRTFQVIAAANQAISGAADVNAEPEILDPIVGQAYFMKAFMYYLSLIHI